MRTPLHCKKIPNIGIHLIKLPPLLHQSLKTQQNGGPQKEKAGRAAEWRSTAWYVAEFRKSRSCFNLTRPSALSAFAARQKLWGTSSPAPSSPSQNTTDAPGPQEKELVTPQRKIRAKSPVKRPKASVAQPTPEDRRSPEPDAVLGQNEATQEPV